MNATLPRLAAVICAALSPSLVHAQYYQAPYLPPYARFVAPDACGPGFYLVCPDGSITGPHYCLRPPFQPFNGVLPQMNRPQGGGPPVPAAPMLQGRAPMAGVKPQVVFPTHPYARSPRDYFMWNEVQEDRAARERRPNFVP